VDARDDDGDTALHMAAVMNSVKVAQLLIERGADIEALGEGGITPLQRAAMNNYPYDRAVDVARLLVESGANLSGVDLGLLED
jgi:ankyrin repeat protein